MPGDNIGLKLLATCAALDRGSMSSDNVDSRYVASFTINKSNMKMIAKFYLNMDLSDTQLESMMLKFRGVTSIQVKDFLKAVAARKLHAKALFNDESTYYNSMRYKPYNGRRVCDHCGKTLALTSKGELRRHNCKLVGV
jgi:hypothetical protein